MTEDRKPSRLPPPAFPPGSRRYVAAGEQERRGGDAGGIAFISPDEPIPGREGAGEGVRVTGIGDEAHLDPDALAAGGDPHVREVVAAISSLAEAVRRRGEAGLKATADMTRFESTLRAYCVGYLVGRRADDRAGPPE